MTAQNVSNLILLVYVIAYIFDRKAVFLIAFFIAHVTALSLDINESNGWRIFFFNSLYYCAMYWYLVHIKHRFMTIAATGIMFLFQAWMIIDEATSQGAYTFMYVYYEYITLAIHICIACSLINWKSLRFYVGAAIVDLLGLRGTSYYASFIWYNLKQISVKAH